MEGEAQKKELMKQSFFQLFRQLMTAYANKATFMLKEYDIHPSQAGLLLYVEEHEGKTQREIAAALHVKPPTTATMISRMEKRNFIFRCQDDQDKRKTRIYLTDYGRELCSFVQEILAEGEEMMGQIFSKEESMNFKEYMARIICSIQEDTQKQGYETKCIFPDFGE